jgi:DNA-binding PadR family transcriptional regulator
MTAPLGRWRALRSRRRQRRVLAVLLLHDLLGVAPPSGWPIARSTGDSSGAVHVALAQLERGGLVCSGWEAGGDSQPRRRLYTLTEAGRAAARVWVERWLTGREGR